jgi:hypothetical protein
MARLLYPGGNVQAHSMFLPAGLGTGRNTPPPDMIENESIAL